ncbi:MAG TPA: molybdate ABC transporter substrate-binding protein [Gemmatimonadales bacterium]|jgi:molybdate transport system substrate-binding protein|nr:molybdate ABC transporter substrate-binding protein [Gemmatimonadales bacterium]
MLNPLPWLMWLVLWPAPAPRTLTVFAAASLQGAFTALGDSLEHARPGLTVTFNFSGSQTLALQIQQGAPADVFASADDHWMTTVKDSGHVRGEPRVFAHNELIVIIPASNPGHVTELADLGRPKLKVVLAAEAVPAGRYARTVLANLAKLPGYGSDFDARVNANVVSNEENVKSVVTKVRLGEADAGMVYGSDVTRDVATDVQTLGIPAAANVIADYPIAVLAHAPDRDDALAFVELVLSPVGQRVLAARGFTPASH